MTDIATLKAEITLCMFDQYGTVVDMQGGLRAVAAPFLKAKGSTIDPNAFVTWWRRTHFENSMIDALLDHPHTPYREIGHLSVRQVMDRAGIRHTEDEVRALVAAIERLTCFPEVPAALARLHTRYKLAVLSNGDPDMLEAAKKYHGIPFDAVISVDEANAFKPHRATYLMAARRMDTPPHRILFVANHEFDCVGAKAAGLRTAFVDRRRRPFARWPHQPDLIVKDMTELAELMA
ncbi:haloacid dehalogenase type II [Rhodopila sp.]|uniref:haloacid dehalogenase type II n=1 Tax=Rhodopila sp. TaxID=2480087 RepID=UPI002CAA2429|nr:haloacid dehalogenase type II [Rhodopila sp.]HVZ10166.1 haloacid dehalogenase type II [Rhodopila sp.]